MSLTRVLITVKTYPSLSNKYDELVCTAGFREDGSWIRIYPVQFRKKVYSEQYKKYDWVELDLVRNDKDPRPESYRPFSHESEIKVLHHLGTSRNWEERKQICLGKIYTNLTKLIAEAKDKDICTSLAVFKPTKVLDFIAQPVERDWDQAKLENLKQSNLFETSLTGKIEVVQKLPYKFSYVFHDDEGKKSTLMIEDWETGQLYWNELKRFEGDETKALASVRKKYFDEFVGTKDLHFYLGTTREFHFMAPNPFIIIGAFYPKKEAQTKLF
ncbi:MAG: hypothetical protein ABJC12_10625 [Saprospiraceae bacterium]